MGGDGIEPPTSCGQGRRSATPSRSAFGSKPRHHADPQENLSPGLSSGAFLARNISSHSRTAVQISSGVVAMLVTSPGSEMSSV